MGNRGHKLYIREAINPALGTFFPKTLRPETTPAPTTGNANSRRLNADIPQALNQLTSGGDSQYDAFQTTLQKRLGNDGLTFQVSST